MSQEVPFPVFWSRGHLSSLGISNYIDSECPPEESKKIWQHLLKCPKCRLAMGDMARVDRIARKAYPKAPKETLSKLLSRLGLKP